MSAIEGELGILARRRIEAEIIKPIYEILVRDYGKQQAQAVIGEAVAGAAVAAGRQFAEREPQGPSLEGFVALQELWEKDDALKVEVIASDAARYDYDVHRCRYAEMYQEMGLGEIGHLLSCNRDELSLSATTRTSAWIAPPRSWAGRRAATSATASRSKSHERACAGEWRPSLAVTDGHGADRRHPGGRRDTPGLD